MSQGSDARFMALALMLGRQGLGRTAPNPAVGCVIVQGSVIVGRGRTADGGRPHAEVVALTQAGEAARGATAFVTLEPCSHHGKTGPCAQALVAAGVSRVVVATGDPNPHVSGAGLQTLRDAGVQVDFGLMQDQADHDHAGFFLTQTAGRPWVTLKLAMTLDGRIATRTGDSQWITGPQARRMVHALRASHDAVMVGGGTVRADNPTLTVRGMGPVPQPVRVVVSNSPLVAPNLQDTASESSVFLCHGPAGTAPDWAEGIACGSEGGAVTMPDALRELAQRGITRVFCEGGGQLAASLLALGVVDELLCFQAGKVIGADGFPGLVGLGVDVLSDAPEFERVALQDVDGDVMHRWRRR